MIKCFAYMVLCLFWVLGRNSIYLGIRYKLKNADDKKKTLEYNYFNCSNLYPLHRHWNITSNF
ncbi:MAG: hypothetical protein CSA94_01280 [Bacteroidetes bacterium]|nr:MAG: hypothetical protein CSA94_01280 [Bacteroidota bacterium]